MDVKVELPAKVEKSVPANVQRETERILWGEMIREMATERVQPWREEIHVLELAPLVHYAAFPCARFVVAMAAHTDEETRFLKELPHELADYYATDGRHLGLVCATNRRFPATGHCGQHRANCALEVECDLSFDTHSGAAVCQGE